MSLVRSAIALGLMVPTVVLVPAAAGQAPGEGEATTGGVLFVLGLVGIVLTLLALAVAGLVRWWRARSLPPVDAAPPLLMIPQSPGIGPLKPTPLRPASARPVAGAPMKQNAAAATATRGPADWNTAPAAHGPADWNTAPPPPYGSAERSGNGSSTDGELVEGSTVRFYRPPDGTLQLLPGRLEIVAGEEIPHDIRFIRARGEDPEVTFGRSDGPPHRHIQLHARTVSRRHARMRFEGKRWMIENLSETNPVVINGRELDSGDTGYVLKEGDRIEMGEVVFCFRER